MKYLRRAVFCFILTPLALILFPFDMAIRYIITGKDCLNKTLMSKLIEYETNKNIEDGENDCKGRH